MALTEEEVRWGYRFVLGREPESEVVVERNKKCRDVARFREILLRSAEFQHLYHSGFVGRGSPDEYFDLPCDVLVHIQKTGGTTMRHLLKQLFPDRLFCPEEFNVLHSYSPAELAPYSVYAGHFDIDSLRYIPRKALDLLTMVREPTSRLLSFYYFNRAHDVETQPNPPNYMKLANELSVERFFANEAIVAMPEMLNGMTRALFGSLAFSQLELIAGALPAKEAGASRSVNKRASKSAPHDAREVIVSMVRRRLEEFAFVGVREEFKRSISLLCHHFGKETPATVEFYKVRGKLSSELKEIAEEPVSDALKAALQRLTILDSIVYEQSVLLFQRRCSAAGVA